MKPHNHQPNHWTRNRKNIIVILRLIVFSVIYLMAIQEQNTAKLPDIFWVIMTLFLLSEIACLFERQAHFLLQRILGWIFIFDAILISLAIYFLPIQSTQLFIAYFAVIAIAAIAKSIRAAFVITFVISAFYLATSLQQNEFIFTEFFVQAIFFFGTAMFTGYLSEEIAAQNKQKTGINQSLSASENKYQILVENLPQKIFHKDKNLVYVSCNENYARGLNIKSDDITGRTDYDLYPKKLAEKFQAIDKKILLSGKTEDTEEKYIQDGREFWGQTTKTVVKDNNGKTTGILGIFRDITERKKTEQALEESERKFKAVFDSARDGIIIADSENKKFNLVNQTACQMLGYSQEEFKNLGVLDIHPKEQLPYVIEQFGKQFKGEINLAKDIPVKRKDGSIFYCDINSSSLMLSGKTYLMGIFRDATQRRDVERKLQQTLNTTKTILENLPVGVIIINKKKQIQYVNQTAIKAMGLNSAEEIIGQICHNKICPAEVGKCPILDLNGKIDHAEKILIGLNNKKIPILKTVLPIQLEGENVLLEVFIDITDRKKLQEQLIQAQKMEAVGTLAGGIAHDFNNLLTVIQGNTEFSMLDTPETDPLHENLKDVHEATLKAIDLTRQLLIFGRKQEIEVTSCDLNQIINNLLKMLKRLIGEDIILKTDLDNRLWTIQADKGNIEQVIMNLVLNARDAMPDGGQITFITENVAMDEEYCRVNLEARPGHFVCFSISDTGTGMNKETLNHLFEPFFTTKAVDKGTGLGLPVVHGIIKQHQGWVNVYSEPKKGSVFRIYLPGSSNQSLSSETEKKIIPQALRSQGERILLIEDEKGVLKFAQGVLTKYGYTVFPTTTVKEAKKIFEREKGDFQLVFSDTILPDGNGLVLIEQLLTVQPDLKVLLSSGYTNGKVKHSVIQQKKIPFIQKPYNINQLLLVVREILKSRR